MTEQEQERILKWAGYYQKEVEHFPDFNEGDEEPPSYMVKEWFNSKNEFVSLRSLPNFNSLAFLMEIVESNVLNATYYMEIKATKNRYSIMFKQSLPDDVPVYSGVQKSLVEALQYALLKLSEAER